MKSRFLCGTKGLIIVLLKYAVADLATFKRIRKVQYVISAVSDVSSLAQQRAVQTGSLGNRRGCDVYTASTEVL